MNATNAFRTRRARRVIGLAAALVLVGATAAGALAGPDPILSGGMFAQNQDLRFRWRSGAVPKDVIAAAIKAAAADATRSRGSKAATFAYDSSGPNQIGYGLGATCGVNGLACFTRDAPDGFGMWLREQGHVFDWGTLKWCQAYSSPPNGCYDAETIALDEFGHVEGLDHHVNRADNSDYSDAVVQTYSRTKPSTGWNAHAFGRCDVATLQMQYDVTSWTADYSTCLDLSTVLTLSASSTTVAYGGTTTLTATLKVVDLAAYVRLGGNPISGRSVSLQRRPVGGSTWSTVAAMSTGSASGTYVSNQKLQASAEYRAVFSAPSDEGLNSDTSGTVGVSVSGCSVPPCPQSAPVLLEDRLVAQPTP
jgi:hypothetical protein